jgi:SWI/SNF-related matrix-associated actin-dependent regulator 1 of chromatin subfamily A
MPLQKEAATFFHRHNGRALCCDEMGLGKTLSAWLYAKRHYELRPVVVICPAFLREHWRREALIHVGIRAEVLEGTRPPRHGFSLGRQVVIIGDETFHAWLPLLRQLRPKLLIVDECHRFKSPESRRTQTLIELCNGNGNGDYKIPHIIGLTGTYILNRMREVWVFAHLLWPDKFPYWQPFADKFCGPKLVHGEIKYDGSSNIEEIGPLLRRCGMIRRRKEDVLDQLPPKRRIVVPLDIEDRKEYEEAERDFLSWLATKVSYDKARRAASAVELNRWGYLKRLAAKLKLKNVFAWVDNFLESTDEKLLLFAIHRDIVAAVAERYGRRCVRIDGSVPAKQRVSITDEFNRSSRVRVLAGNIKAAGLGLSVKASTTAFAEIWWVPADHDQAESRTHGIGRGVQGKQSTSYYLIARGTVEELLLNVLERKSFIINTAIDGGKGDPFDVFAMLTEEYRREKRGTK